MKKRIFSWLLVLSMVLSMVVLPANAQPDGNITLTTEQCPCGCGPISQVNWVPYNMNDAGASPMGHYYLDKDYAQEGQKTIISDSDLVIDLRGHTLTSADFNRMFLVEGYMAVLDTVGGGRIQGKTSGTALGGVIMIRMNETNGSTFELYSGTITVDPTGKGSTAGGLIYISGDKSTFRMFGGVLRDGHVSDIEGKNVYGGAIAAATATTVIDIQGGTILNCSSPSYGGAIYSAGSTTLKNCRIINCTAGQTGGAINQAGNTLTIENCQIMSCEGGTAGGAIYSTGTTTITDSRILQCTAVTNGGNIYQKGGSLTTKNCEIAYGTANGTTGGGNMFLTSSAVYTDTNSIIHDGASNAGSGGNLYAGGSTHTLTGTKIYGGVTRVYGANVVNWAKSTTRLIDCEIDGDVRWGGEGLSLEGKTKITLRSNGLNLVGGEAGTVISGSKLTDGAEIFVSAHWGTFTNDAVNAEYFKPALRTVLTQNDDGTLSGDDAAVGEEAGYCPHCYDPENPQKVTWQAYTATTDKTISESGHYFVSKAMNARLNIAAGIDVVFDLNGYSSSSGHRCFVVGEGATLSLLDFSGAGKLTGKGGVTNNSDGSVTKWPGGVIYGSTADTLNIYGGTYIYSSLAEKHISYGGVIYAPSGSSINIYGGTIDGSSYNKTDDGYKGGAIYLANGTKTQNNVLNISAGRIIGGNTYQGGALYTGGYCDINITGGVISGGSAQSSGGNISLMGESAKRGTLELKNCAIVGGVTETGSGGNIYNKYYNITAENCYIANGNAKNAGNVIHSYSAIDTLKNSIIVGGTAFRGGNVYTGTTDALATYENCLILAGEALSTTDTASNPGCGGNVRTNNGRLEIKGGEIALGSAVAAGGNAFAYSGVVSLTDHPTSDDDGLFLMADSEGNAPLVTDGYATTRGGNVYVYGICELQDAVIEAGRAVIAGQDIYFSKYNDRSSLTLGKGVQGDILMDVSNTLLGTPIYGNPVAQTTASTLNANITLESKGIPLFSYNGNLFIGSATVVGANGNETWYVDNATAVSACGEDQHVKLYTNNDLVLTKELFVDLNGQTVAVSGDYLLSGMDTTGDSYTAPTGKITGTVNVAPITRTVNRKLYLPVSDSDSVTFHRLGLNLTDIVLKPENAGIYYQASWNCDDTLRAMIAEYGIVSSLTGMPDADFRNDDSCLSATFTDAITNGAKKAGVLIENIMKSDNEAALNQTYGEMPIYTTAYITLNDGSTFVSDNEGVEDDVCYSLYTFMETLDTNIAADPTNFRKYEKRAKEFYAAWEENGMGQWTFNRLKAPQDSNGDGAFNVLMIGNSFCSYYMQELWGMLDAAGYENVHIYNVYYSGCWVEWHHDWWKQGKSNYSINDANGLVRYQVSNAASLEFCLSQANWDVISLQESSGAIRSTAKKAQGVSSSMDVDRDLAVTQHLAKITTKTYTLLDYFHSEFPQARILWHQTWAHQIGYDRDGYAILDAAQQAADMNMMRDYALAICEGRDYLERVPSGEAWQVCREKYGYDNLCARLGNGTNHSGDYYHDGDIGGGQLLNASVWYEIITGLDCRENSFVPSYTYNDVVMDNLYDPMMIKSAAHEAVEAMRAGN